MTHGSFILTTRWRKGEPMLSLAHRDGKVRFDTIVQPGSALGTQDRDRGHGLRRHRRGGRLPGLNARGRIAVVQRSDAVSPAGARRRQRPRPARSRWSSSTTASAG